MIYLSEFKSSIRDPLYGLIQITQPELSILKTIPVTRMRWIKQMGLACLVFPGANHTRFEHSLGTMFVADRLIDALIDKTDDDFLRENLQAIRFAALLHDLGHSPFSHVTEEFFRRNPEYLPTLGENYDHEIYTEAVIHSNKDIRAICKKENIDPNFVVKLAAGKSRTFLDSLLSSSIDVDKIDYVARDSYFCGLPYGRIDLSSLEGITLTENSFGDEIIAFEKNCRDTVEGLLMSRFYLMTSIHIHERNCAANQLLFRAMAKAYDLVLEPATELGLVDDVKNLILDCLHFQWVDHDLITFLADPFQKTKRAAIEASWGGFSRLSDATLQTIAQQIPPRHKKSKRRYFSYVLLNRVLQGKTPNLKCGVSLVQLSPLARYNLYVLHRLSLYTAYLNDLKRLIQKLKACKGKRIFVDITAPKLQEINTKILVGEKNLKNLFDVSSLSRSLVSETTNRLTLSIYAHQKIGKISPRRLEPLIGILCRVARRKAIKKGKNVGTDLILIVYYYLHHERMFFSADTRFQAFFAVLFDKLLSKSQSPYKELVELPRHFGDLNKEKNYEVFRENGYPDFFSVNFAQDLDVLTEMGLIYTRSGPVKILGTAHYPKRYERRISRHGREYVETYLLNSYPFVRTIRKSIKKALSSQSPLINLNV